MDPKASKNRRFSLAVWLRMKLVEADEILGGDLHSIALDREGRVHSTGSGLHGALGRGGLASTGEELDFQEVHGGWWRIF